MLLSKKILIKRINPLHLNAVGDLVLGDNKILVKFRWKTKEFSVKQIEKIKAYALTDWGLQEYENIDIFFSDNYQIKLDASLKEHQDFVMSLLRQLNIETAKLDWGYLSHLGDKMERDIIFERNNIR